MTFEVKFQYINSYSSAILVYMWEGGDFHNLVKVYRSPRKPDRERNYGLKDHKL